MDSLLKELYIENLAIIEKASISFCDKLNIFSGETGAGKSILIGGINAIMGGRVTKDIVRAGAEKSVIIGLFDDLQDSVIKKLDEYGFSCEDELMLQRDISADGKSTARINGRVTTAAVLKEIVSELINIHGQHDNQILLNADKQREILDNYGNLKSILNEYRDSFKSFSAISRRIKKLQEENLLDDEKAEILRERINEIDDVKPEKGEEAEVEQKLSALRNSEKIQKSLFTAYLNISGDDEIIGGIQLLENAKNSLSDIVGFLPESETLIGRLDSLIIELNDIENEIFPLINEDDGDGKVLSYYEERISQLLRLKRKYGKDIEEIIDDYDDWKEQLFELENREDIIDRLLDEKKEIGEKVKTSAKKITEKRKVTAKNLVDRISKELEFLDMPNVVLVFDIKQDKVTINGIDNVEMLISVNKGEKPKPISKIASGGELSRIMLAIKNVLANNDDIPTMIFDEIDTGISGRAAQKVGIKLSEIAQKRQVLCVTHLAQIAAMADNHLLIEKKTENNRTYTEVYPLEYEGRKREIARIISGDMESDITLKNAEELLKRK